MDNWTINDTHKLYQLNRWGGEYFDINKNGHLDFFPAGKDSNTSIDIMTVIKEVKKRNISLPVVVRFNGNLTYQVKKLNNAFLKGINASGYKGNYCGVYPVKVNQIQEVVEEVVSAGEPYGYGLEAGSKSELLSVLSFKQNAKAMIILNGFKDDEYIRLALYGICLGKKIVIVIDNYSELASVIRIVKETKIKPIIGFRAKLSSKTRGRWSESSGDGAKFGLTATEILLGNQQLLDAGLKDSLKLLHFHIGSQIPRNHCFEDALTEGARLYTEIKKINPNLAYFDVGGGLGVDYDGSQSTHDSSKNYSLTEYVNSVVGITQAICDTEGISHPNLITESGRMITASHSCILTEVFDSSHLTNQPQAPINTVSNHQLVQEMQMISDRTHNQPLTDTYDQAIDIQSKMLSAFNIGRLSLAAKAEIETLFNNIKEKTLDQKQESLHAPRHQSLSNLYFCNFSLFQSIPDSWAVGQLLPVIPIHRLNERPSINARLADITCDSDGKIDQFISKGAPEKTLPLHPLIKQEPYYLGVFFIGAYQDVMGSRHNLFGRVNEVHVCSNEKAADNFMIEKFIPGETSNNILTQMQYNIPNMISDIKVQLKKQVHSGHLNNDQSTRVADFYEHCINGYTYLNLEPEAV